MPDRSDGPRGITTAELYPLAVAADRVDTGLAPAGSPIGKCPACGADVIGGESWQPLHTFDVYWVAKPCDCLFVVSEATLRDLQARLAAPPSSAHPESWTDMSVDRMSND